MGTLPSGSDLVFDTLPTLLFAPVAFWLAVPPHAFNPLIRCAYPLSPFLFKKKKFAFAHLAHLIRAMENQASNASDPNKRGRPRKRPQTWDQDNPDNWTFAELKDKLIAKGAKIPATFRKRELLHMYRAYDTTQDQCASNLGQSNQDQNSQNSGASVQCPATLLHTGGGSQSGASGLQGSQPIATTTSTASASATQAPQADQLDAMRIALASMQDNWTALQKKIDALQTSQQSPVHCQQQSFSSSMPAPAQSNGAASTSGHLGVSALAPPGSVLPVPVPGQHTLSSLISHGCGRGALVPNKLANVPQCAVQPSQLH